MYIIMTPLRRNVYNWSLTDSMINNYLQMRWCMGHENDNEEDT